MTHINRILAKLGLTSRPQLVVLAYETGLVRPGDGSGVNRLAGPTPDGVSQTTPGSEIIRP
jgi:hypothetical protein